MKTNGLMSFKEYFSQKRPNKYFFDIRAHNQILFYCGIRHFTNPDNSQVNLLVNTWNLFLRITDKNNCIVLVEGELRRVFNTLEESVINAGDPGLVTFLAARDNIPTFCPEPNLVEELNELKKKYSLDHIIYFYFVRNVQLRVPLKVKMRPIGFMVFTLDSLKERLKGIDYEFTLDNMKRIHKDLYQEELNPDTVMVKHGRDSNIIEKISTDSMIIRDIFIISEVKRLWDEGKNIFGVFGKMHVVRQEAALKAILK